MRWRSELWLGSWVELPNGQCEGLGIRRDSKKIRSDNLKAVYAMLRFNKLLIVVLRMGGQSRSEGKMAAPRKRNILLLGGDS